MILDNPVIDRELKYVDLNHRLFTNDDFNDLQFEWIPFAIRNNTENWEKTHKHIDPVRLLFDYEDALQKVGEDDYGKKVKVSMNDFI